MRSFVKSLLCSVLLGFSISMPAQNLPALQKDGSVTMGELENGISYYLVTNTTMKGVADFALVRKGSADTLAARKELASLPHFNKTIPYKFLSRKGIGCRPEGYISYGEGVTVFRFDDVPMYDAAASDTTLLMLFDLIASQPCRHAVVISGDINTGAIMEKMKVFSLMVPSRNPSYEPPQYAWTPTESTKWEFEPSRTASVEVDFRSPRTPAAQMNTIQPFISELFSIELGAVVKNRLRGNLVSRDIQPYTIDARYVGSADTAGDEHFIVRMETPESQLIPASMALSSTLASLGKQGVGSDEYLTVRADALGSLSKAQSNDEMVRRCISAYLYGSDLATSATKAKFFISKNMSLDSELKLFNDYSSAILSDTENATVKWTGRLDEYEDWVYQMMFKSTWNAVSMLDKPAAEWKLNHRDTSSFGANKGKSKLKSTYTDPVSGGEVWSFSNEMRVIYKKMATGGRFSFSMMVKGGFSNARNLPRGEGAFFSDMLFLEEIAGLPGDDFRKLLKINDVDINANVNLLDTRITGTAPSNKYQLVIKALLSIANDRAPDNQAFDSYCKIERSLLKPAVLDSLLYPGFDHSEIKTPSGLTPTTLTDAETFFYKEFLRCSDGVILLVGELPAAEVQKYLAKTIGGFRVSKSVSVKQPVSYKIRKGASTYTEDGEPVSISVGMAAALPFTTENYMASRIAALALKRRLSGAMAEQGYSVSVSQRSVTFPQEAVELIVNLVPAPESGLPIGVQGGSSHPEETNLAVRKIIDDVFSTPVNTAELASCKAFLANEYSIHIADPSNYSDAVMMRYSAGKDVLSMYNERINNVTLDNVMAIFGALSEGMRVEYVIRPGE